MTRNMALAVNSNSSQVKSQHTQSGEPLAPGADRHLRRSNALRIKSNNYESLPLALRESLLAIRRQISAGLGNCHKQEYEEEELTLLEQIKRGVKLKPVSERGLAHRKQHNARQVPPPELSHQEESLSTLLVRVLRQRYLAMQQAEDEDDDSDNDDSYRSHTSSIDSGDLYLVGYEGGRHESGPLSCVLYGSGETLDKYNSKRRQTLLERLGDCSAIGARAVYLTNDLVIRL